MMLTASCGALTAGACPTLVEGELQAKVFMAMAPTTNDDARIARS